MTNTNLGNKLYSIVSHFRGALFNQAEFVQLTYGALEAAFQAIHDSDKKEIEVTYPVGYSPDRKTIPYTVARTKEEMLHKYQFLAFNQLSINGMFQLVVIVEAMLGDVISAVVQKYPHKLNPKRSITLQVVLEATSIEEVHIRATNELLNELSYQSPNEYAKSMQKLISINILECPAFHKYLETKASRDIFIHNRGVANDIYFRKSGSHSRARKVGDTLPIDNVYFLESYEACLQITEWLETKLHDIWHSSDLEAKVAREKEKSKPESKVMIEPKAKAMTKPKN